MSSSSSIPDLEMQTHSSEGEVKNSWTLAALGQSCGEEGAVCDQRLLVVQWKNRVNSQAEERTEGE